MSDLTDLVPLTVTLEMTYHEIRGNPLEDTARGLAYYLYDDFLDREDDDQITLLRVRTPNGTVYEYGKETA